MRPSSPPLLPQAPPQRAPTRVLVAESSALCAQLALGTVILLPRGGAPVAPVLAPLALARGASRSLLLPAAPPSAPTMDCVAFAVAALRCAVPFFAAIPYLNHGAALLALFTVASGASQREGVALVALQSGSTMMVRFPRSPPRELLEGAVRPEVNVLRRVNNALAEKALSAEVAVESTQVRFVLSIVVRDINFQSLRELLRNGGADFPALAAAAPPPLRVRAGPPARAPASAPVAPPAAMAVEVVMGEEALPLEQGLKDMRKAAVVRFSGALGVMDGETGGLLRRENAGDARLVKGADRATSLAAVISQGYHVVVEGGAVFVPSDALPVGAAPILEALAPAAAAAGAAPPPSIADEFLADVLGAAPLLPGAAAGRPGLAVRQATAEEIVAAASGLPPRSLEGRMAISNPAQPSTCENAALSNSQTLQTCPGYYYPPMKRGKRGFLCRFPIEVTCISFFPPRESRPAAARRRRKNRHSSRRDRIRPATPRCRLKKSSALANSKRAH